MGFGASLILIAAGAILWWAVDVNSKGVDLNIVGTILFVIGVIGLLISLVLGSDGAPWRRRTRVDEYREPGYRETVYREGDPAGRL
jgi:hypothetical protein